jgi:GNAT superfamily N-acetyltransferase
MKRLKAMLLDAGRWLRRHRPRPQAAGRQRRPQPAHLDLRFPQAGSPTIASRADCDPPNVLTGALDGWWGGCSRSLCRRTGAPDRVVVILEAGTCPSLNATTNTNPRRFVPSPMSTSTRRATDDIDAVSPLFDAYRRFYDQPADLPRARAFLLERMQLGQSLVLLAERDGMAVGFAQLYPMFSSVRTAPIWILNDLYVAEGARRCGIGRHLLSAAEAARATGAARLMLETSRANAPARAIRDAGWERRQPVVQPAVGRAPTG